MTVHINRRRNWVNVWLREVQTRLHTQSAYLWYIEV